MSAAEGGLFDRLRESQGQNDARGMKLDELRRTVHQRVIHQLGAGRSDRPVDAASVNAEVQRVLGQALQEEMTPLSAAVRHGLIRDVTDDVLGHGPIEQYLQDRSVSEIMVNGPDSIYVEREGKLECTGASFVDEAHLRRTIERIVSVVGRRIDESSPMVDARLPDGSRVNAVFPPLAIGGPFLTIRKFATDPFSAADMIAFGTLTPEATQFLEACVRGRLNITVSGGTSTGKTTLLNVLSSFVPESERMVTIEDSKELQLRQAHVLSLEARPPNTEGRGEITIRDLVRNALRMRPDRIIVGECRSGEALDMLQAMNTGHEGSLTTVHANSPRDALSRIETMTLMSGFDLPLRAIREQMSSAIDLVIQLSRLRDGSRRVTHVTEVERMEGEVIVLQDVFLFDFGMGVDEGGGIRGRLKATGLRPGLCERLADRGVEVPASLFDSGGFVRAPVGRR